MIKRLAPSSYALKLAEGVRVQEILAFLTHGLIGELGSSNTYMILMQFLMVRLTCVGVKKWRPLRSHWYITAEGLKRGEGGNKTEKEVRERENGNRRRRWSSRASRAVFFFIISPIAVVGVQLKATNSEVLILASKEDKDK